MSLITNRLQPRLQILQARAGGLKYCQRIELIYKSGQGNPPEYRARLANHYNYPVAGVFPEETGRIALAVSDDYWQSDKLQAKEVANDDPHTLGMDSALDEDWANLHGFTVEAIHAGGWRDILIRINGSSLNFTDGLLLVDLLYPAP